MYGIELKKINVFGNRIEYQFSVDNTLRDYFNPEQKFVIEYFFDNQKLDISSVPNAVLAVPFVCNVLPIVWITGTTLYVPELDQAFYNCISEVKKGYEVMFPETEWTGKIEVTKAIACDKAAEFGKCAMFYSGGIDSTQTLISHLNEHPMLVSVWGSDLEVENQIGWEFLKNGIDVVAKRFQLPQITIKSTFRKFDNEGKLDHSFQHILKDGWWHGVKHGLALLGHVAPVAFYYNLEKMYIASSHSPEDGRVRCASNPLIDDNVRYANCTVIHDGFEYNRQKKTANIVKFSKNDKPIPLHVCWESQTGGNCCHCEKCFRTIIGLLAEDADPNSFGFQDYERYIGKSQEIVKKNINPNLCKEWRKIKRRMLSNLDLQKSKNWKHIKWVLKTDFEHPDSIELPRLYKIRGKLLPCGFYQLLHHIKEICFEKCNFDTSKDTAKKTE